ncbi:MAG TPA: RluA family pseudouridine synthase [Myxococcota bacterium]|nr:RluA family pseudouridine synthase [Myxococcota bacterium]
MSFEHRVPPELAGQRLDAALAKLEPSLSRAQVRRLIEAGEVTVSGALVKPAHRLRAGEAIAGRVPEPEPTEVMAEELPLAVLFEDGDVVVIDKPAGLVVHPAPGHSGGTLVNALLHHCRDLSGVGGELRPGIVHRLDKDTSGVLVVAKNDAAHRSLAAQFKAHSVLREYLALVRGSPRAESGTIEAAIGRHPTDRKRMSTKTRRGRAALTHYKVEERLRGATLLRVRLGTGRTHQVRVHLSSIGLAILGDPVYGGGRAPGVELGLRRQALHAAVLGFTHPRSGDALRFESPLPADLARALEALR